MRITDLIHTLGQRDPNKHSQAAEELVELGASAVESLIEALESGEVRVQIAAARILGKIGDDRAIAPLSRVLQREYKPELRRPAMPGTESDTSGLQLDFHGAKAENNTDLGDILSSLFGGLNPGRDIWELRRQAAFALAQTIRHPDAIAALIKALSHVDGGVRSTSAEALASIGRPGVGALINALRDAKTRGAAFAALGQVRDARAVDLLVTTMASGTPFVRRAAAQALGSIGDARAVEPLIAALMNRDILVRSMAARSLGQIGDRMAVGPLTMILAEGGDAGDEAAEAVAMIGDTRAVVALCGGTCVASTGIKARLAIAASTMPAGFVTRG